MINGCVLSLPWDRCVMVVERTKYRADEGGVTGSHRRFVNLFNSSKEVASTPPVISTSSFLLIS